MKKENKISMKTLIVLLLLIVMLTLVAVSGTYAKYTTSLTGKAQAVVAHWEFTAKKGEQVLEDTFTIDLGETITNDSGVGSDEKRIQPGSKGEIVITVDNSKSDVDAKLDLTVNAKSDSIFSTKQFVLSSADIKVDGAAIGEDNVIKAKKTATVTIPWEWKYDVETTTDSDDTEDGKNAVADESAKELVEITVKGTQVEPGA